MPKQVVEYDESSSESEGDEEVETPQVEPEAELPTLEEELEKAKKNTKLALQLKEQKKRALEEKRLRLAEPKAAKIPTNRKPRFEKGSEEAKEWSRKMSEARRAKLDANKSEKSKLVELEEEHKAVLYETKEQEIRALKKQLERFQKIEKQAAAEIPRLPEPEPKVQRKPRVKKQPKTPVVSDTEDDTEVEEVKQKVRRKRVQKAVAKEYIQSEQDKMREQMLSSMKSNIFNM